MNSSNVYTRTFQEAVSKAFGSLIADYNFSLKYLESGNVELISQQCVLLIGRGYHYIGVGVKPARADQMPKPRVGVPMSFDLHEIARYFHYNLQPHYGSFNTPDELLPTCERLAGYARQYCKPMLEGDFSIWPKLLEQRRQGLNRPK